MSGVSSSPGTACSGTLAHRVPSLQGAAGRRAVLQDGAAAGNSQQQHLPRSETGLKVSSLLVPDEGAQETSWGAGEAALALLGGGVFECAVRSQRGDAAVLSKTPETSI